MSVLLLGCCGRPNGAHDGDATERQPRDTIPSPVGQLGADLLHTAMLSGAVGPMAWADVLWVPSYLVIGAAALVPSMRELGDPDRSMRTTWPRQHRIALGTALLVLPITAVAQQVIFGHIDPELILIAAATLSGLLLLSVHDASSGIVSQERRWSSMLAKASDAFAVADPDGTIRYVSPASTRILGTPTDELTGASI